MPNLTKLYREVRCLTAEYRYCLRLWLRAYKVIHRPIASHLLIELQPFKREDGRSTLSIVAHGFEQSRAVVVRDRSDLGLTGVYDLPSIQKAVNALSERDSRPWRLDVLVVNGWAIGFEEVETQ